MRAVNSFILFLCSLMGLIKCVPSTLEAMVAFAQEDKTWSEPQLISTQSYPIYTEYTELISDPYGRLHAFWDGGPKAQNPADQEFAIYYTYLDAETGIWREPLDILVNGRFPVVRIDSTGTLHLFASTDTCLIHASSPSTEAYSAIHWMQSQTCLADRQVSQFDVFLAPDDSLHLAYEQSTSSINYLRSDDAGLTWSAPSRIVTQRDLSEALSETAITIDNHNRIHVAWVSYPVPDAFPPLGIWYAFSDDGFSWSSPTQIAEDHHLHPQLFVSGEELHAIWNGALLRSERYHRSLDLNTETWSPITPWISATGGVLGHPDAVVDGNGDIHAFGATDEGLWYAQLQDAIWLPAQRLYDPALQTGNPNTAILLNNELHVIFRSRVDSIWHIMKPLDLPRNDPLIPPQATEKQIVQPLSNQSSQTSTASTKVNQIDIPRLPENLIAENATNTSVGFPLLLGTFFTFILLVLTLLFKFKTR
ncbi:MAG: hypothetical protein KC415_00315 [Anaerolineales bacterium]|nr:hypothetical protein [Anaerolineales bacterium]